MLREKGREKEKKKHPTNKIKQKKKKENGKISSNSFGTIYAMLHTKQYQF